jgi:hypothetical protein
MAAACGIESGASIGGCEVSVKGRVRMGDKNFCKLRIRRTTDAGQLTDEALPDSTLDECSLVNRPAALRKARENYASQRFGSGSGMSTRAEFDVIEAVDLHVKHIRGENEQQVVGRGGDVVTLKNPPSYPALKAYRDMVLPKRANKFGARAQANRRGRPGNLSRRYVRSQNAATRKATLTPGQSSETSKPPEAR